MMLSGSEEGTQRGSNANDKQHFLRLVEEGDINQMQLILERKGEDIINCTDDQNNSALSIALRSGKKSTVHFLLRCSKLEVKNGLLVAIKLKQQENVKAIVTKLKREARNQGVDEKDYVFRTCTDSPEFPSYMTPLMVAAENGHVEIIDYLIKEGHEFIEYPHIVRCGCKDCEKTKKTTDPLYRDSKVVRTFRALCNPAYIYHTQVDPILNAFYLVHDLRRNAKRCRVFLRDFEELIKNTEKFAADMIAECRTAEEVRMVLNEKEGSRSEGNLSLPRLRLAVDYEQHQFVAERNVQVILEDEWDGDWHDWVKFGNFRRGLQFFVRIPMLPVLMFVCIFLPNSKISKFYSIPVNRMLNSSASYFVFLIVLYIESIRSKKNQTRYQITSQLWLHSVVTVYVLAQSICSVQIIRVLGVERFVKLRWNLYDMATQLLFFMTIMFWIIAYLTMEWQPDIERKYWHYLDPQLCAEGTFCIATILSFLRLLQLLEMKNELGPLQVSLTKTMTSDFALFIVIFLIVMASFAVGMCRLDSYYRGMTQWDDPPGDSPSASQPDTFVSMFYTIKTLFWITFTMASTDSGEVVIENLPVEGDATEGINTHPFTQAVGSILFGVNALLVCVVLLNMLIAAMTNTFQRVTDNADVEWIFGRTEVYLFYMSQPMLPPPFNLFWIVGGSFIHKKLSDPSLEDLDDSRSLKYEELVKQLFSRYYIKKYMSEDTDYNLNE